MTRAGKRWTKKLKPLFLFAWSVLYAFAGAQMAWVPRPRIGAKAYEYTFLRTRGGTFTESVLSLFQDL